MKLQHSPEDPTNICETGCTFFPTDRESNISIYLNFRPDAAPGGDDGVHAAGAVSHLLEHRRGDGVRAHGVGKDAN